MCPDFPKTPGGGATAAEVWGYATRSLNSDTANAIRDAILSDANKIAGARIDTAVSSRAPASEYNSALAVIDSDVLSRAPGGEYDTELDVPVSSRAAASEYTAGRAAKMDKIQDFLEEAFGTITANGTEQTVKEILNTVNKLHCFVDLTLMAAGDVLVVRQYMKIKAAGSPVKYAEETYSGAQTLPMLYIVTKPAKYGIKIALQQTGGTNRDYDWETFQEKAA